MEISGSGLTNPVMATPVTAAGNPWMGAQPGEALLQVPSGRIAYRLSLPVPFQPVIEHDGYRWVWSHRCLSGATYARGRTLPDA